MARIDAAAVVDRQWVTAADVVDAASCPRRARGRATNPSRSTPTGDGHPDRSSA